MNTLIQLSEYVGCQCHNTPIEEYKRELTQALTEYFNRLMNVWNLSRFEQLLNDATPLFILDYCLIQKTLYESGDLPTAQKSLFYWKDAIPEILLQDALIALRYAQIASIVKLNN